MDSNSQSQPQQLQPADTGTVVDFGGQALFFLFVLSCWCTISDTMSPVGIFFFLLGQIHIALVMQQ